MSKQITFGSVCSGIEAASVAWHPLGWRAAWLAEIEPFPSAVLAHHYPEVPNLGDMTRIARAVLRGEVEAPDVLAGGTPCQAFSIAGLREGLDDARGQLTLSYVRLFDAIDYVRGRAGRSPAICVWENVPGVLSDKTNAFGCFLAGLAGEDVQLEPPGKKWANAGCVFGPKRTVAWRILDAQYAGVAQRRRRVFVIASARKDFDPARVLFEFDGARRDSAPSREAGKETAGTLAYRTGAGGFPGTDEACSGYLQPVASTGDVSHCLNAGGMGRQDFETETLIAQSIGFSCKDYGADASHEIAPTMRAMGHSGSHANAGGQLAAAIAFDSRQDPVSSEHVFGALGSSSPQAQAVAYAIQAGALRANPMSGPDGVGVQEGIAYTMEARAEVQAVCVTGDVTHTLKAEGFDASEDGTGRGQPIIAFQTRGSNLDVGDIAGTLGTNADRASGSAPMVASVALRGRDGGATAEMGDDVAGCLRASGGGGDKAHALIGMAVRRLTPRECERLQGFPDDYTLIPWVEYQRMQRAAVKHGSSFEAELRKRGKQLRDRDLWPHFDCPDGPRYKALGNSMAVPVMRWIGSRIDAAVRRTTK